MKEILLASNNKGKVERFRNLVAQISADIKIYCPEDLHIEVLDTEETGKTLAENAEIKARAYFGKTDLPILSNDTGFFVEGEGLVEAPKREALGGMDEKTLTKEEIANRLLDFWKGIAKKHGGKVGAAWIEEFVLLYPDGTMKRSESRRDVILTDTEFGNGHIQMPVRALYISKTTNKPSIQHTPEEEVLELQPITDALKKILSE